MGGVTDGPALSGPSSLLRQRPAWEHAEARRQLAGRDASLPDGAALLRCGARPAAPAPGAPLREERRDWVSATRSRLRRAWSWPRAVLPAGAWYCGTVATVRTGRDQSLRCTAPMAGGGTIRAQAEREPKTRARYVMVGLSMGVRLVNFVQCVQSLTPAGRTFPHAQSEGCSPLTCVRMLADGLVCPV